MGSLVIFAGAGASRGVSGEKYPMALDFRKRLPEEVKKSQLYGQLVAHLNESGLGEDIDIEHILWELGRLNDSVEAWTAPNTFASRLLTTNTIAVAAPANTSGPHVHRQFGELGAATRRLQDQINERVYEFYAQPPDIKELKRSWIPLLEHVYSLGFDRTDIVTTNYDLVIESALEELPGNHIGMGFQPGLLPGIDLEAWRKPNSRQGMLTKLHGSVDWKLGNGSTDNEPVIRRGHPEFDGDHRKRLILYPGFKGVPSREPFVAFHEYFRRTLRNATHLLFIGFAFRDDFINQLIASTLPAGTRVAVVNPTPKLPPLPFLNEAIHLKQGFGIEKNATILASGGVAPFSLDDFANWARKSEGSPDLSLRANHRDKTLA